MKIFVLIKLGIVVSMQTGGDDLALPAPWVEKDPAYVAQWQAENPPPPQSEDDPEQEKAALQEKKAALEAELAATDAKITEIDSKGGKP